jgi:hypothetical protein
MFAALTVFLFIIAVQGYFEWKKIAGRNSLPVAVSIN